MNRAWSAAWDQVEKVAREIDPDATLVRQGHRFTFNFTLPDGSECHLWAQEDAPRYGLMVNGISVRLHAGELVKPVAEAIAATGIRPTWETPET